MNKRIVTFYSIWAILTILISVLVIQFYFVPSLNKFEICSQQLNETQKMIENDFNQIYQQTNYKIYSSKNGITVEITQNDAILKCYYSADKQFIKSEITGAAAYTDNTARIVVWICIIVLSMVVSVLITASFFGITNMIYRITYSIKRRQ